MSSVYHILLQLEKTYSTNAKRKILADNSENENLKKFFIYALDTNKSYGVKREFDDTPAVVEHEEDMDYIFKSCDRLQKNKTGINKFLNDVLFLMSEEERDIFRRILKKDPSCGVSESIVNSTWPKLIDSGVKLCKAEPFSDKLFNNYMQFPVNVQTKEDGARCTLFVDYKNKCCDDPRSSSGKPFNNLDHIKNSIVRSLSGLLAWVPHDINTEPFTKGFYIDGELLVKNNERFSGKFLSRKEGNGILNKSIKNTISKEEAEKIVFVIWDCIPCDEWNETVVDENKVPYNERLFMCDAIEAGAGTCVSLVDFEYVNSKEDIARLFKEHLNAGKEGIIIKNSKFLWKNSRIKEQLKLKLELDTTLEVIDWSYGDVKTKYEHTLGSLKCKSSDGIVTVSIGSGFSDSFREEFMKRETKTGWFVEVRSNGLISCNNEYSLFLPRFIEERFDKTEADSYDMIKKLQDSKTILEIGE